MPIYPYKCANKKCKHEFEDVQSMANYKAKTVCPECNEATLRRVFFPTKTGAIISAGDTTGLVLNEDGSRYRLKTGTEKDQKREIALKLEQKHHADVKEGKYKRDIFKFNVD